MPAPPRFHPAPHCRGAVVSWSDLGMRLRLLLTGTLLLAGAACGDDGDDDAAAADARATLEAAIDAENAGDAEAVVGYYTDEGLDAFFGATREEIAGGEYPLGEDGPLDVRSLDVTVDGDTAEAIADVRFGIGLFRVPITLVRDGDEWLIDGMGEPGAPPPPEGVGTVEVSAVDFAFVVEGDARSSGEFLIDFRNEGEQQHEMALFRIPAGTDVPTAIDALGEVDGGSYDNVPDGYEAIDHLTFAPPGEGQTYLIADRLEAGDYAFVCFIPEGGLDDETGDAVDPDGRPHVQLGMLDTFTVV